MAIHGGYSVEGERKNTETKERKRLTGKQKPLEERIQEELKKIKEQKIH